MAGRQQAKREETQRRVLTAAIDLMREQGIEAVQIRNVAARAGCAVGSVYKHFADQDALMIAVNAQTLSDIKTALDDAVTGTATPVDTLKALARGYLAFAKTHTNAWRGLFAHHLPEGSDIPDTHKSANIALLEMIAAPLKEMDTGLSDRILAARARTCFAAMHGLVSIALEERFVALGDQDLETEMDFVVERLSQA